MDESGVLDVSVTSPKAKGEETNPEVAAEALKLEGNAALKAGELDLAIQKYTEAIELHPTATYYSNRAAVYHKQSRFNDALADAESAIALKSTWWKAHSRKISALYSLKQHEDALAACEEAEEAVDEKENMQKFLKPTRKNVRRALLTQKLIGKWHGKNSDPMFGETVQEFEWLDAKKVKVMIIGQKLECTYKIRTDLDSIDGGWRMDIIVPQQPFVPYIFRLEDDGTMSMVAPQVDPNMGFATPTTFAEGTAGLIHLSPGEPPVNLDVHTMSRDEKILDAIEQLSSSFTAKLPQQQQLSEMEQLMQGLQVMQIMSVKIQNKYGTDIFQAAEKITENPDLAGTNVHLREAATKLKATITKVQKAMGQATPGANPAVHNTPSNTENATSQKSDGDAPVASVEVADDDVLAEAADSVIADFEKFSASEKAEETVAAPVEAVEADPQKDNEVAPPAQGSASASAPAEDPVAPAKSKAADDNTESTKKGAAATQRQRSRMPWVALALAAVGVGVAVGLSRKNSNRR